MNPVMSVLLRKPGAWVPMALALGSLALLIGHLARFGVVDHEDEGAPARLFQLLLLVELVGIAYFGLRWMPKAPKPAAVILALQVLLAAIPVVAVEMLERQVPGRLALVTSPD